MSDKTFKAYVVEETENNVFVGNIKDRSINDLPEGEEY